MTAVDAERSLGRNVVVGVAGLILRSAHLLLLFTLGRLFGAPVLGRFLVGLGLFEIASAMVATGFVDGTVLFVSRHAAGIGLKRDDELASSVATALLVGGALALVVGLAGAGIGAGLVSRLSGEYAALLPHLPWLAAALLPALVAKVSFAASTAFLRLEWEALVGASGPAFGVLAALPLVRALGHRGEGALFVAFFAVQVLLATLALAVLARRLGARSLARALLRPRLDRKLLAFAVPQGLNMAASAYVGRLDVLALAASGIAPALVGVYGAVAAIVVELRQVRMVVSSALAPIVARHHAEGDRGAVERLLSNGAAWIAGVAVPIALVFAVVRGDIIGLVTPSYAGDSLFALLLLAGPVVNCLGGLSGNFLVYLLRNRWNLANALFVAMLGTLVLPWLVRRYGLAGAALGASAASAAITLFETLELGLLEGVRIRSAAVGRALVVLFPMSLALGAIGEPRVLAGRVALGIALAVVAALVIGGFPTATRVAASRA
jgi:O-antigen/teichoic acid export membrane protein